MHRSNASHTGWQRLAVALAVLVAAGRQSTGQTVTGTVTGAAAPPRAAQEAPLLGHLASFGGREGLRSCRLAMNGFPYQAHMFEPD